MTTAERRLDRLMPAFNARERAIMFLQDYKAGVTTDPYTPPVPSSIEREYERLMQIIRFVNGELADCVLILKEQVAQAELRLSWLQQAHVHAGDLWMVRDYLDACVKEPVTESELRTRKGKAPLQGYDVRPDADADEVALLRKNRALVDRVVKRGALIELPLDLAGDLPAAPEGTVDTLRVVACIIRECLASYWSQLAAIEQVASEYADDFDGEDPLKPHFRAYLDDARQRIVEAKDDLLRYIGAWGLPDEHDKSLAVTRALAERVLG